MIETQNSDVVSGVTDTLLSQGRLSKIDLSTPNMGRTLKDGEAFMSDAVQLVNDQSNAALNKPQVSKKDSKPLKLE